MTKAASVVDDTVVYLHGASKSELTSAGTYSTDFIASLQDVADDVGVGYKWDGYQWVAAIAVTPPHDFDAFETTRQIAYETAVAAAQETLTSETDARNKVLNDQQAQIDAFGTMADQNANAVAITGGTITGITDLAVADGGTGAGNASGARTNLGLVIGTDVQAYDATLKSIAALGTAADRYAYTTGVDTWAEGTITTAGRAILDDANAAAQRATLGSTTVGDAVFIAANAGAARTAIGTVIGTDVQAYDATLTAVAAYDTNGIFTQTAKDTFTGRTITKGSGISVTNGSGVSGDPTIALDITGLTADTAPETTADYLASYDNSAAANKKVLHSQVGGLVYLTSGSPSSAATVDIVLTSYTAYRGFKIFISFLPATDGVELLCRFSTDGGSTFATTGYNWAATRALDTPATTAVGSGSDNSISISGTAIVGNASTEGINSEITLLNLTSTSLWSRLTHSTYFVSNAATPAGAFLAGGGSKETAQDTDAIRFLFSSGNIASGTWAIYGLA